jgi:UDP-glucose 4-epimerase
MQASVDDRFYNVGTGKRTSIKELAEMVNRLTNNPGGIEYVPEGQTFVRNRIGATENASNDIGFNSTVELETGLRELITWRNAHKEAVDARRAAAG